MKVLVRCGVCGKRLFSGVGKELLLGFSVCRVCNVCWDRAFYRKRRGVI